MNKKYFRHSFDLMMILLSAELKTKYSGSFLGYFWSILHPLLFAAIYLFAFKIALRVKIDNYAMFLIAGLFPWQAIQNSLNSNSNIFLHNGDLIKNIIFPKVLLPLIVILNDILHFILSIPILIFGMFYYHFDFNFNMCWLIPVLLTIQLLITFGISLFAASINIFVRDMERLISIFTMLWFFSTPIIYMETMLPKEYCWVLYLNPITGVIVNWRNLFMGQSINFPLLASSMIWCVPIVFVGFIVYKKVSWRFAEVV
ncbi:MAG: ABC transporter permease [Victivallaceae bacterium]|nr:ABC transporter permease [Victivallaceae bacterium]